MRSPSYSGQFRRDVKLAEKRGKDMKKLRHVIGLLLAGEALPRELGDRPLRGPWKPRRFTIGTRGSLTPRCAAERE